MPFGGVSRANLEQRKREIASRRLQWKIASDAFRLPAELQDMMRFSPDSGRKYLAAWLNLHDAEVALYDKILAMYSATDEAAMDPQFGEVQRQHRLDCKRYEITTSPSLKMRAPFSKTSTLTQWIAAPTGFETRANETRGGPSLECSGSWKKRRRQVQPTRRVPWGRAPESRQGLRSADCVPGSGG